MQTFYIRVILVVGIQTIFINSSQLENHELQLHCLAECKDKPFDYKIFDPNDCTAYYSCQGEIIKHEHCNTGMKFDIDQQMCINGTCPPCPMPTSTQTPSPTSSPTPLPTSSQTPSPIPTPTSSQTPSPIPTPTMNCTKHGERFPNELHCRYFWECVETVAVFRFCEKGMWYDRDNYVCNYPELVKNCPVNQD